MVSRTFLGSPTPHNNKASGLEYSSPSFIDKLIVSTAGCMITPVIRGRETRSFLFRLTKHFQFFNQFQNSFDSSLTRRSVLGPVASLTFDAAVDGFQAVYTLLHSFMYIATSQSFHFQRCIVAIGLRSCRHFSCF